MSDTEQSAEIEKQLEQATRRVVGESIPSRLQAITDTHLAKLMELVGMMRVAGVDEALVRHSVHSLIESYEAELVDVMTSLSEEARQ